MEDILAIGQELLAVKESLPHGQFRVWLRTEFDWNQRTAERFMGAAQRFGSKIDTMSIMRIDLAAAYLLAAPATSELVRQLRGFAISLEAEPPGS